MVHKRHDGIKHRHLPPRPHVGDPARRMAGVCAVTDLLLRVRAPQPRPQRDRELPLVVRADAGIRGRGRRLRRGQGARRGRRRHQLFRDRARPPARRPLAVRLRHIRPRPEKEKRPADPVRGRAGQRQLRPPRPRPPVPLLPVPGRPRLAGGRGRPRAEPHAPPVRMRGLPVAGHPLARLLRLARPLLYVVGSIAIVVAVHSGSFSNR